MIRHLLWSQKAASIVSISKPLTCDIWSLCKSAWTVLGKNLVDQVFVADKDQLALAEREDFVVLEGRKVVSDENQDWHLEITNVRELSGNVKDIVKASLANGIFQIFVFLPFLGTLFTKPFFNLLT